MTIKIYERKASECARLNLRRAYQSITNVYDEFLKPSEIKIGQFSLIKHIYNLAPITVSSLATHIRLDRTTLVRNLKSLEKDGIVDDIAAKGTRNRQLRLTEKGVEVYKLAEENWRNAQSFLENYLGKEELNNFTNTLSKIEALMP